VQISIYVMNEDNHHCFAPELSKHLTTLQCPDNDAIKNGECPTSSHKLISAPELSKHLTTLQCPWLLNVY
jgi:hypothetical protein